MVTLPVFVLFLIPTALATNFGMLLAFRFLTGFIGSPVLANGGANIADMYRPQHRAYAMTAWGVFAVSNTHSHSVRAIIIRIHSLLDQYWVPSVCRDSKFAPCSFVYGALQSAALRPMQKVGHGRCGS